MTMQEAPDLVAIKSRQQATWADGDFGRIGVRLQLVGESLCEAADVEAGERVIDVAAGNGNASLAAARRFARVTSTDYVPALLEQGRRRAEADGLAVDFRVADAEDLPFEDASFDVALSTFGVMFAPDQERAARELRRVVRPGGRIGLACWTRDGVIGRMFAIVSRFVPPPSGLRSPLQWGDASRLRELFGPDASIRIEKRHCGMRYESVDHWIEYFRTYYGPTLRAFAALDEAGRTALRDELTTLARQANGSRRGALVLPAEYLEVVIS